MSESLFYSAKQDFEDALQNAEQKLEYYSHNTPLRNWNPPLINYRV